MEGGAATPHRGHPLFKAFVQAALDHSSAGVEHAGAAEPLQNIA